MGWKPGETLKLTKAISENLGVIRSMASDKSLTGDKYKYFKASGGTGRKKAFLDAYRAFTYSDKDPSIYMPKNTAKLAERRFIPQNPFRQKRKYRAVFQYDVYDKTRGVVEVEHIEISSSRLFSENTFIRRALEIINRYGFADREELVGYRIASITYSPTPTLG